MGERLIDFFSHDAELVHAPLLMDSKYCAPDDEHAGIVLPQADLGLISGCVNNEEHEEILREMRRQCTTLVALGTCATHGGIPALMNVCGQTIDWQEIFQTTSTEPGSRVPDDDVPAPLDRVYGCDEKAEIDMLLPGCPPNPAHIAELLQATINGRQPELPARSVCDSCPVRREGKGDRLKVRRFLENADFEAGRDLSEMRCLLEQGFMCMGPVTLSGCASNGAPRCIQARVPCRGCYGPVRQGANQMLDMMNAMTSNGIDYKSVVDRRSILRFTGGHGRLRFIAKR